MSLKDVLREHGKWLWVGGLFGLLLYFSLYFTASALAAKIYFWPAGLIHLFFPEDEMLRFLIVTPFYAPIAVTYFAIVGFLLSLIRNKKIRFMVVLLLLLILVLTGYGWWSLVQNTDIVGIAQGL